MSQRRFVVTTAGLMTTEVRRSLDSERQHRMREPGGPVDTMQRWCRPAGEDRGPPRGMGLEQATGWSRAWPPADRHLGIHHHLPWIGHLKSAAADRTTVTSPARAAARTASSEVSKYGVTLKLKLTSWTAHLPPW